MTDKNWTWEETIRWIRTQPVHRSLVQDGYYDDPIEAAATRYWRSSEWSAVAGLLPAVVHGVALDFGAGRGISSFALSKTGFDVVALESNNSSLVGANAIRELARISGLPIRVVESSSSRLPFDDSTFDVVFGRAVLHHVSDLRQVCKEFARVLKPGGTLLAIREHVIDRQTDLERFQAVHPLHRYYGGETAYTVNQYAEAMLGAGFRLEQVLLPLRSPINFFPYSEDDLRLALARRLCFNSTGAARMMQKLWRLPGLWGTVLWGAEAFDRRPGRLYSFLARRPP